MTVVTLPTAAAAPSAPEMGGWNVPSIPHVNCVHLIGMVVNDLDEVKVTKTGKPRLTVRLMTNVNGAKQYHNVVFWENDATMVAKTVRVRTVLHIWGHIDNHSWQDAKGNWKNFSSVSVEHYELAVPTTTEGK